MAVVPFNRPHTISISHSLQLSLSCTIYKILSIICQNLKKSRKPEHISLQFNLTHASVLISINLHPKFHCLASPTPKIWQGLQNLTWDRWPWPHNFEGCRSYRQMDRHTATASTTLSQHRNHLIKVAGLVLSVMRILRATLARFRVYVCVYVCMWSNSSQTTEPICIKIIPANRAFYADC